MEMDKYTIGIDLGGTKFHMGLVDSNYNVFGETIRKPSHDCSDAVSLLNRMANTISEILVLNKIERSQIRAIGVGAPGPLDPYKGIILNTLNLTVFQNFALKDEMEKATGIPTFVDNDANCFGLGEQKGGVARGLKHVIALTLGTGYGFTYILNGNILHGATGHATEIALTPYRGKGYEDYISGRGLAMIHHELHGEMLEGPDISQKAFEGEKKSLETFSRFGEHLANTIVPFLTLLDPDMLVVGGSVAANWDFFAPALDRQARATLFERPKAHLRIEKSTLGELATIIGAGSLADVDFVI